MFGLQLDPEEKQLLPFCGLPVCVLMKDGSRKVGQLTACASGRLTLNGSGEAAGEATISRKESTRRNKRPRSRKMSAQPSAEQSETRQESDDFSIEPFGLEPLFSSMPRENVPLKMVDSILIL